MKHLFFVLLIFFVVCACQKEEATIANGGLPWPGTEQSFDEDLIPQLDNTLHPFSSRDPLNWTNEDLQFLDKLATKKIVGLGEATHGTSEFFKAKHRIFQYLVEEHGFKVFAFEADFGESLYINQAIQDGRAEDIKGLMLKYMKFWTWKTEEVLDLLEWMAIYNQGKADVDKVHYMGVDCQFNTYNPQWILDYLQQYDEELYLMAKDKINDIAKKSEDFYGTDFMLTEMEYEQDQEALSTIIEVVESRKNQLLQVSSLKEYGLQLQLLRVLSQTFEVAYKADRVDGSRYRDQYMAENAMWLNEYFGGAKVVVWAHNYHVSRPKIALSMGKFIRDNYDEDYHIIGFSFSTGKFMAIKYEDNNRLGLQSVEIKETPNIRSINYLFSKASSTNFTVNLSELIDQPQWSDLFFKKQLIDISIGASFDPNSPYYSNFASTNYHDLIHIEVTTAAKQLQE